MIVLAIGAHFDDIELGCGGTIAKHISQGDEVIIFVATKSGYSNINGDKVRKDEVAATEGIQAIKALGVKKYILGNFATFELEFNEDLNKEILSILDKNKVDCVYTHWSGDIHHDHQALAKSTLHCCRHIKKILMYRSNWYTSDKEFRGNFFVDISDFWQTKKAAIECHVSELERTSKRWITFWLHEAENEGLRIGTKYAEVFEVVKWIA